MAAWAAVAVKRNDKIGLTGCDKSRGCVCRGRQVKCAAGVGGDGDRIGGERVGCAFGMQRPEFYKSGLMEWTAGYNIMQNVGGRGQGVAAWTVVEVKRNDKIGQTGCDKQTRRVCRGREVKCAAGEGGGW